MRTMAFLAIISLTALSVWLIFAQASSGGSVSDAQLTRIVAQAEQSYTAREKQSGLVGLKGDIDDCYRQLGKSPKAEKVAYCIALDDITTRSNLAYGPGAEQIFPYFGTKQFDARASLAVRGTTASRDGDAFRKRVLSAAEPAAKRAAAAQQAQFH